MPAWMTHPDGPGGLQESGNGGSAVGRGGRRCDTVPRYLESFDDTQEMGVLDCRLAR